MSTDTPPTRQFVVWSWVWWVALLVAVPVQALVIGSALPGSVGTFRPVGRPIGSPPGTPAPPLPPRMAAGDAASAYLRWLPLTQIVLAAVVVQLPNRPVKSALRAYRLWVWLPLASVPVAWLCCQLGHDLIHNPPL